MSCRREAATNAVSSALSPATKREVFHAAKYSDIVGVITTSAVNASSGVGSHAWPAVSSSFACAAKSRAAATRKSASGSASPNLTLPSPSRSGSTPLAANCSSVPHSDGLGQEHEVARLLVRLAGRRLDRERHRVLGVGLVGAGVDDHVEVGQRRHAGDHALHLLVRRVGLAGRWPASSRSARPPPRGCPRAASRSRSRPPRRARGRPRRRRPASPCAPGARRCGSSR